MNDADGVLRAFKDNKTEKRRKKSAIDHKNTSLIWRISMKKYLTLAVLLGAIAFVSVSFLAQANEPAATTMEAVVEAPAAAAEEAAAEIVAPVEDAAAALKAECEKTAAEPNAEGVVATAEEQAAAVEKCLAAKSEATEEVVEPTEEHSAE